MNLLESWIIKALMGRAEAEPIHLTLYISFALGIIGFLLYIQRGDKDG